MIRNKRIKDYLYSNTLDNWNALTPSERRLISVNGKTTYQSPGDHTGTAHMTMKRTRTTDLLNRLSQEMCANATKAGISVQPTCYRIQKKGHKTSIQSYHIDKQTTSPAPAGSRRNIS